MFKKIAVLAMTLASFGAVLPATAAAAADRRVENRVVVEQKVIRRHGRLSDRRVIARRAHVRKIVVVKHA